MANTTHDCTPPTMIKGVKGRSHELSIKAISYKGEDSANNIKLGN